MTFVLRPGCLLVAVSVVLAGCFLPALRHGDGWLAPEGWFTIVVGLAAGLAGVAWHSRFQAVAWFFALALIGQGAALQLIHAPPYGIYQHVLSLADIAGSWRLACLILVLAHGLYIGWAGRQVWPGAWRTVRDLLNWWQLVLLVLFLLYAAILVSTDGLQYGFGVLMVLWIAVAGALNLVLLVRAVPEADLVCVRDRVERWLSGPAAGRIARRLPWVVAMAVTAVSAFLAAVVYEGVPHLADSITYLFQAKYFSMGQLYVPVPPDDVSFKVSHLVNDGEKLYGYGFPGWPAVLALGVLLGVPWLVNPVLGGATILLTHGWVKRLYDERVAHAVILLLAVSPWFLYSSGNFLGHALGLLLAVAAFVVVERARDGADLWRGLLAGAILGLLFLTRPLEGIVMSLAVGLRILGVGGPRPPFRMALTVCVGAILVGGVVFPYDQVLTGDPLYPPQLKNADTTWYKGVDRIGFGPDIGNIGWTHHDPLPGHSPLNAAINANKNSYMANLELFGWSFGSLAFVALACLFRAWARNDLLFWGIILLILISTALYWHPGGPDFGARYWYQGIIPCVVLTVRGAWLLAERIGRLRGPDGAALWGTRVGLFVAAASLAAVINFLPWRAVEKYHHYKARTDDVALLAKKRGFDKGALVFVRSLSDRADDDDNDYPSAFILNPPNLSGPDTIYARYLGPEKMAEIRAKFPGRPVWLIGRDAPGAPIRVIEGPAG